MRIGPRFAVSGAYSCVRTFRLRQSNASLTNPGVVVHQLDAVTLSRIRSSNVHDFEQGPSVDNAQVEVNGLRRARDAERLHVGLAAALVAGRDLYPSASH